MPKSEEEGIRVYLRIRPPPTSQQSRLLASNNNNTNAGPSPSTAPGKNANTTGPRTCQYEIEDDFHKSILHLHTTQRLLQDAQRSAGAGGGGNNNNNNNNTVGNSNAHGADSAVPDDVVNNTVVDFRYRFDRVFKPTATQEDVFNTVAKECVASVLDGLNSTVFAYGQTGSGKTFSITGGTESYQDRGLIPRAMAMIYDEVARRRDGAGAGDDGATTYTITMSYLQIYNDKGQDLLNHGHDARTLEELPPVSIHEMEDDIVLKGLEQHSAPTLPDALNLLFLGDTNRLYCETPMNKTSSRSHCIFTVYIEARSTTSSTVRRSKLNLVDLAGSERVSKTGVSGTILTEAKHINLSLHFLEQVIVALSEKAKGVRDHIPYRNSFLTMVLRDSLGRNCKTAMLATAHVVASQVAETISTCQFAQRVAMIQQAPQANVETDPVLLVKKLKAEVAQLKDEVAYLRANGGGGGGGGSAGAADRALSEDEKNVCRNMVDAYVQRAAVDGEWSSRLTGFNGDMARMYYCYDVLRERLVKGGGGGGGGRASQSGERRASTGAASAAAAAASAEAKAEEQRALREECEAEVKALRQSLQLKENELQMLLTVLKRAGANGGGGNGGLGGGFGLAGTRYNAPTQTRSPGNSNNNNIRHGASNQEGNEVNFQFSDDSLSPDADAHLRQEIYQQAQQLIHQLRQSAPGTRQAELQSKGLTQTDNAGSSPVMSRAAAEAAAQAALTRVTTLAQQGQLTEAEAAAATEFLESKKGYHHQQQHQQQQQALKVSALQEASGAGSADGSTGDARTAVDVLMDEQLVNDRAQALEAFKATYEAQHKVEETKQLLRPKYDACKATAQQLNACVDQIKQLKTRIQRRRAERAADGCDVVDAEEAAWLEELRTTKEAYNTHAGQLRRDKEEIDGMHAYLKHAQEQLVRDFERWFSARQQQVQLAVQQQQRQAQQRGQATAQAGLAEELRAALANAAVGASADHVDQVVMSPVKAAAGAGQGGVSSERDHPHPQLAPPITNAEPLEGALPVNKSYNSAVGSSGDRVEGGGGGGGYQALSAPLASSSAALGRLYPSSAPANTSAVNTNSTNNNYNNNCDSSNNNSASQWHSPTLAPTPFFASSVTAQTSGSQTGVHNMASSMPNAAEIDAARFPASARAQNRLASLPTHMPPDPPLAASSSPPQQPQHQQQTQHGHPPIFSGFHSARSPDLTRREETAAVAPAVSALYPLNASTALNGLGKMNGWMTTAAAPVTAAGGFGGAGAGGGGGGLSGRAVNGLNGTPPAASSALAGAPAGVGARSPTRPFHLQPLAGENISQTGQQQQQQVHSLSTSSASTFRTSPPPTVVGLTRAPATQPTTLAKAAMTGTTTATSLPQPQQPQQQQQVHQQPSNPYFPQFPSTGNAAADEQLAQLYKAREAMRKQLQ